MTDAKDGARRPVLVRVIRKIDYDAQQPVKPNEKCEGQSSPLASHQFVVQHEGHHTECNDGVNRESAMNPHQLAIEGTHAKEILFPSQTQRYLKACDEDAEMTCGGKPQRQAQPFLNASRHVRFLSSRNRAQKRNDHSQNKPRVKECIHRSEGDRRRPQPAADASAHAQPLPCLASLRQAAESLQKEISGWQTVSRPGRNGNHHFVQETGGKKRAECSGSSSPTLLQRLKYPFVRD